MKNVSAGLSKFLRNALWVFLLCLVFLGLFDGFQAANVLQILQGPSWQAPMGTDSLGRDLLLRSLQGTATTLAVGLLAALVSFLLGVFLGAFSGWYGGWMDLLIQRLTEVITALPSFVFVSLILFLSSEIFQEAWSSFAGSIFIVGISIGLSSWTQICRLTRALMLKERNLPYVESARSIGRTEADIMLKHIFPNLIPTLLIAVANQIPQLMLFEGFLSFVGLGLRAPLNSWGLLIRDGWRQLATYPHLLFGPALLIVVLLYLVQRFFVSSSRQVASRDHF